MTDLASIQQYPRESVQKYVQRFRELRNQSYSPHLEERFLAELTYKGLNREVKIVYGPTDFESIGHLVSKVSAYERSHPEVFQEKQRRNIGYVKAEEDDLLDDADTYLVQWARTSQPL